MRLGNFLLRILLFAAALAAVTPAHAEPPPGSRINRPAREIEGEVAQRVIDDFIRCIVRSDRDQARRLLDLPYLSPEQDRAVREITRSDCVDTRIADRLVFRAPHLVGRIAEVLYLDRHADADLGRLTGLSDEAAEAAGLVPRNNAEDLALCVVRRDPQAVRTLIGTAWNSDAQAAAVRHIVPHLGPCLPEGEMLDLNARTLRLLLAAGLYRAVTVAPQG